MSTGFLDAGLGVAAGFELDRRAVDAYDYNHSYRGSRGRCADLSVATSAEIKALAGLDEVDFVLGGPPCQPFSIVGKRRGEADERANLIDRFAQYVVELRPKAFLFENVPNLASIHGGRVLHRLLRAFGKAGYGVRVQTVLAADYGVPQLRKRLFVLGIEGAAEVRFPRPTHGPWALPHRTAADALGDLPDAGEFGECGVYNHEPTEHSPGMLERLSRLKAGTRERGSFHDRLHPDRPSYTLRAGSGNFSPLRPIHYRYHRVVTVRESARIQGFADTFIWPDRIPRLQQYRQVGNAVAPPVAAAFARALAEQLGWPLTPSAYRGDPGSRPPAMEMSDDERRAFRRERMRGASLGLSGR